MIIFATLLAVISCGQPAVEKHVPELMGFVPSDALAVASYDRVCDVLTLIDTASPLRTVDYGRLRNSKAVLSLCYTTSLTPILAIDTGKATADTTGNVAAILAQADSLGIRAEYIHDGGQRGALVLSTSLAELNSTRRHFAENASVLDAPAFKDALEKWITGKNWIIFRNGGADKYIPRAFLLNFVQRREFIAFLQKCADWTALIPVERGRYQVETIWGDFDTYFTKALDAMPISQSKLGPMLPRSTEFAIALPMHNEEFREAYKHWLDAMVRLEKYEDRIAGLKKETGKSPIDWEKELDVREVAIVKWNNRTVTLVRPGRTTKDSEIAPNPWKGFIPALYGSAFAVPDDSEYACSGGWTIFGGEEDLEAFLLCEHGLEGTSWPGKHSGLIVYGPDFILNRNKEGMFLSVK